MANSLLIFDITPLKRQPGKQFPFRLSTPPPSGAALATAEVAATELHMDLLLESVGEQLMAVGTIGVDWVGPCRRCLESQTGHTDIKVKEIFEKVPADGETYALGKDEVDLEPMVRETVLLNLPVAPLCSETCEGPDPDRFPTSVVIDEPLEEEPPEPAVDPRWAGLAQLTFDE